MFSQIIQNQILYKYGTNNLNKKIVKNSYTQVFVNNRGMSIPMNWLLLRRKIKKRKYVTFLK
jgi:hypothetical protein